MQNTKDRVCLKSREKGGENTIQLLIAGPKKACAVEAKFNRHTQGKAGVSLMSPDCQSWGWRGGCKSQN